MSASASEIARLTALGSDQRHELEAKDQELELLRDRLGDALRDKKHAEEQQQLVTRSLTSRAVFLPVDPNTLPDEGGTDT